jgi:DNA-binding protein HU-beta
MSTSRIARDLVALSNDGGGPTITTAQVADMLDALGRLLADLPTGERVHLPGVGTFARRATAARTCRNPRTGEPVEIPAGTRLMFRVAKRLR